MQPRDPSSRPDGPTSPGADPAKPTEAETPAEVAPARPQRRSPSAIELGHGAWIEREGLRYAFTRSSGPGGQNVNKVNTRAELRVSLHDIGGIDDAACERLRSLAGFRLTQRDEIVIASGGTRSQLTNREACLDRLRDLVMRAAIPPKVRKKTKPTRASKLRRLKGKRMQSEKKRGRQRGAEE